MPILKKYLRFTLVLVLICSSAPCFASDFSAHVVGVTDGDTIKVVSEGKETRIRLYGIDCPEKGQPYWRAAKEFATQAVAGKTVNIRPVDKDRWGRTVAWVFYDDVKCLNKDLLQAGMAWHYKRYSADQDLSDLEKAAQENKSGLWQDPGSKPPWEYRRRPHR